MKEETGLDIEPEVLLDVATDIHLDKEGKVWYHYVLVDYVARVRGGRLRPNGESTGWKWFSRSECERAKTSETTRRALRKYFENSGAVASRRGQRTRTLNP